MQLVAVPHVLRTESQCQQMHVESHLSILHVFTASASACS